jgi:hypothetical protein
MMKPQMRAVSCREAQSYGVGNKIPTPQAAVSSYEPWSSSSFVSTAQKGISSISYHSGWEWGAEDALALRPQWAEAMKRTCNMLGLLHLSLSKVGLVLAQFLTLPAWYYSWAETFWKPRINSPL